MRDFPGGPVVKNPLPMQGTRVRSLVGELRSHMPWGNYAHAPQLLSMEATTREPACRNKEPTHHSGGSHMPQRRSHVPPLRPDAAKNKINK